LLLLGLGMKIYLIVIKTTPSEWNEHKESLEGALASVWVKTVSAESALLRALRYVSEHQWLPQEVQMGPIEIEMPAEPDLDLRTRELVDHADRFGISAVFDAWVRKPS